MKPLERFPSPLRHALLLGVLVGVVAIIASSDTLHTFLLKLLSSAESIVRGRPVLGVIVFVLLAAVSAMVAFVSSAVIVPVGILVWGRAASVLLLWLGWILGGVISYLIGKYLGRPVVKKLSRAPYLEHYERFFAGRTSFALALLLQFALPSEVPGYLLGLARFSCQKYLLVLLIAELPYAIATIFLGDTFLHRQTMLLIALAAAVLGASMMALHSLHNRLSRLRSDEAN